MSRCTALRLFRAPRHHCSWRGPQAPCYALLQGVLGYNYREGCGVQRRSFGASHLHMHDSTTSDTAQDSLPLSGITVVSLEQAIAGPFCTRQLADLGARVIKVERPGRGDFNRDHDQRVRGLCSHFVWTNRSKESLALDLKQAQDLDALKQVVAKADVLVQNLAPGAADRLGLGYGSLKMKHPSLIVCDISGYGSTGPYRNKKAYDLLIQSMYDDR